MFKHVSRERALLVIAVLFFLHGLPGFFDDSENWGRWTREVPMLGPDLFFIAGIILFAVFIALECWKSVPRRFKRKFKWLEDRDDTEAIKKEIKRATEISEEALEITKPLAKAVMEIHSETFGHIPKPNPLPTDMMVPRKSRWFFKRRR